MKRKTKNSLDKKRKTLTVISGLSGGLSFLGGWQVCHNLCLGIVALLSVIGITTVGMPLFFLTQYTIYFWLAAVLLLVPTGIMYMKYKKYISSKLIFLNIGIIIASIPFFQDFIIAFWLIGGILIVYSIFLFVRDRYGRK